MARYRMDDGTVVDTQNATQHWDEAVDHDGRNFISRATGSQWAHQQLHRSRRGRYWLECRSQWQGSTPYAEWISKRAAAQWLLLMEHDLPADLSALESEVSE